MQASVTENVNQDWKDMTQAELEAMKKSLNSLWEKVMEEHDPQRNLTDPYNVFAHKWLPEMVAQDNEFSEVVNGLRHTVKLIRPRLCRPAHIHDGLTVQLTLDLARTRNLHYNGKFLVDVIYTRTKEE